MAVATSLMVTALAIVALAMPVHGAQNAAPISTGRPRTAAANATWWKPTKNLAFQYQLGKSFDVNKDVIKGVQVYIIDCWDTPAATVAAMKSKGLFPVGYFSAGSYENWRSDKASFPKAALGKNLDGWAGEKWLDVRNSAVRTIMAARIKMCKNKGFLGIEGDNVDGYSNPTGFKLTYADQVSYNKFLATTAHSYGLAAGLKNDVDQIKDLVGSFDFAINEQCNLYKECGTYAPFKAAGKPVWNIEYKEDMSQSTFTSKACPATTQTGLRSILSNLNLDATFRVPCPAEGTATVSKG